MKVSTKSVLLGCHPFEKLKGYRYDKKLFNNRNKVYLSWLASYAVVLFIPLIIGSMLYIQSIKVISEEVNRAHDASLEH